MSLRNDSKTSLMKITSSIKKGNKAPGSAISSVSVICDQPYDLASLFCSVRWIGMSLGPANEPSFVSSMGNGQSIMGRSTGTSYCSHFYALVCPAISSVTASIRGDLQL